MRRVVITGMGVITPLGDRLEQLFEAVLRGESGVRSISRFDARSFPTTFAAEVRDFSLERYIGDSSAWRDAGEASQFAAAAGILALHDAGLAGPFVSRDHLGLYLGSGEGKQDFQALLSICARSFQPQIGRLEDRDFSREALARYHPGREYEQELHTASGRLASLLQLGGPNLACLTACAAGTQAIGEAFEMIRSGESDGMLAGGSHSMIYPLGVTGFNKLGALSTRNDDPQRASRPFDLTRDGFVLGEGAGMLVLEELDHARRRNARLYAEVCGFGLSCDAYRVTDCHPEGRGAAACMRAALKQARLNPEQIDYINAHGTSTRNNDAAETAAIKSAFGDHARRVAISSTKGVMGHLIAAAGAVELILCVLAIRQGVAPPTANYEYPDPACDLDYIPNVAREMPIRYALSNSFG
ncbi:MAG: beta-ketoacyl-[acyl-carrier-protein] synthase family protein, partial [Gemmataceae bacterium]